MLDVKAFSLDRIQQRDPRAYFFFLLPSITDRFLPQLLSAEFLQFRPGRQHDMDIGAVSLQFAEPVQLDKFKSWLSAAVQKHNFMRLKGVVSVVGDEKRCV